MSELRGLGENIMFLEVFSKLPKYILLVTLIEMFEKMVMLKDICRMNTL